MSIGAKATNLTILRDSYPDNVPAFLVVPFEDIITDYRTIQKRAQKIADKTLQGQLSAAQLRTHSKTLQAHISLDKSVLAHTLDAVQQHSWQKVSIRTSASSEDSSVHSFAGQYVSFVDIAPSRAALAKYIKQCFMSLFSERVLQYATTHALTDFTIGGSVVVQEMFYGTHSGVLFTEDGSGHVRIASIDSWHNTIVEGDDATNLRLPRTALRDIHAVPRQLRAIATASIELEQHFHTPLDIEWAYDNHAFMLLQARPQTTDTTEYSLSWDATNISENYPGITLPLTYSFIRNLYSQVYPSFFRLLGISEQVLQDRSWVFDNALGYIGGRVYYRIENWYEIVKLLPGSKNQQFFEAMLNPVKKQAHTKQPSPLNLSTVLLGIRLIWLLLRSPHHSRYFKKHFATTYHEANHLNWEAMSAEACLDHLESMRRKLLIMWGKPILNDVRVMIFHGIFKTVLLKNADNATYLAHLQGLQDRASIKPLEALDALGTSITEAINRENVQSIDTLRATESWSEIIDEAQQFIDTFGGRTPDELQLENPRLGDDINSVIELAHSTGYSFNSTPRKASASAKPSLWLRPVYAVIVRNMRSAIDYRERFRFNRAQIFGTARTVYLAIGRKLVRADCIDAVDDIFWLTEEEINGIVRGHSWDYTAKHIVAHRKATFNTYDNSPLHLRISGSGILATASTYNSTPTQGPASNGTGVSPGRITAPAIVVTRFDPSLDVSGKILIVKHVDPGWTLLLVQAAGVISEQGNALSHVAIVSREIAIPAIVGIKEATTSFTSGDTLTIDGTTGEVTRDT